MKFRFHLLTLAITATLLSCKTNKDQTASSTATTEQATGDGVVWTTDINAALAEAKKTGKLLFVECYSPTCPVCQSIAPYFNVKEVGTQYNKDFVNYKLDVGNAEQVKFLTEKNIWLPSFPQFLFFDGDGNLVHQAEVDPATESLLAAAKDAMTPANRTAEYKTRFKNGERDFAFLVKYGVYTRLVKDTVENHKIADALFQGFPKEQLNSQNSWAATKKVVSSIDNGFFQYWINNIPTAAEYEKKAGHPGVEMNALGTILQTSIMKDGYKYGTKKLQTVKDYIRKVGGGEYADTYVWEQEVRANIREGKNAAALNIGKNMSQKFAQNGASLVYIASVFNSYFPDKSYVNLASEWLKSAQPTLADNAQKAEYHYELARLSQKRGDLTAAKTNAAEALKLATTAGSNLKKFNDLTSKL